MTATRIVRVQLDRPAAAEGARAALSLAVGYLPFSLALGASFSATDLNPWTAWSSSWLLFGGAAQAAAVSRLDAGDAPTVIVVSCLVINARHLLYGASLRPLMTSWTTTSRAMASYFLTDPVYALASARFTERADATRSRHHSFYFGAAMTAWASWLVLTGAGMVLGEHVPAGLPLHLAAPLTFLLLLLPMLTTRPARVAAGIAVITATAAAALPMGIGLLVGISAGITAGGVVGGSR